MAAAAPGPFAVAAAAPEPSAVAAAVAAASASALARVAEVVPSGAAAAPSCELASWARPPAVPSRVENGLHPDLVCLASSFFLAQTRASLSRGKLNESRRMG